MPILYLRKFPLKPMPVQELTRYYPGFPQAIPLYKVGCIRVTHPCATILLLVPFNLHVLGLPLAFILSQDQTLHCVCFSFNLFFLPIYSKLLIKLFVSLLLILSALAVYSRFLQRTSFRVSIKPPLSLNTYYSALISIYLFSLLSLPFCGCKSR